MKPRWLLIAMAATTAITWILLGFRIPLLQRLPGGWFWKLHDTPLEMLPLIGVTLSGAAVVWFVLRYPKRVAINVMLLVLLGYGAQLALAFAEGRGIDGLRDRLVETGHADFAVFAATRTDLWEVATEYETVIEQGELAGYAKTKPPGTALFFMTSQSISAWFGPTATVGERFRTLVYPLLCYLALIPLFVLSRRLLPEELSLWPCILYVVLPNVTLITLHLDQVLYPTLFLVLAWLVVAAHEDKSVPLALLAGVAAYLTLFFSFSLLAACLLLFLFVVFRELRGGGERSNLTEGLRGTIAFGAGLVGAWLVGRVVLGYEPVERFRNAIEQHEAFKGWEGGFGPALYWAASNWLELALWIGWPVALLCIGRLRFAVVETMRNRARTVDTLGVALACTLLILGLFGRTQGEVARLWLFLGGVLVIGAACAIADVFSTRRKTALALIVALQWVTVLLTKRFQDFW